MGGWRSHRHCTRSSLRRPPDGQDPTRILTGRSVRRRPAQPSSQTFWNHDRSSHRERKRSGQDTAEAGPSGSWQSRFRCSAGGLTRGGGGRDEGDQFNIRGTTARSVGGREQRDCRGDKETRRGRPGDDDARTQQAPEGQRPGQGGPRLPQAATPPRPHPAVPGPDVPIGDQSRAPHVTGGHLTPSARALGQLTAASLTPSHTRGGREAPSTSSHEQ